MMDGVVLNYSSIIKPIKYFTVFGERHSSTKFLRYTIESNLNIECTYRFNHKHWIGNCNWNDINKANDVLFVGIVRNIYDWIGGMNIIPHHLSLLTSKTYEALISEPFISCDYDKKLNKMIYHPDRNYIKQTFYRNIFEARYYKNIFLYYFMPFLANNYILLTFENFTIHHANIIKSIQDIFGITKKKRYRVSRDYEHLSRNKKPYDLPANIIEDINCRTKWEAEHIFGYSKIAVA